MRGELLSALLGGLTGAGQGLQQQRAFKYKQDQDAFERQRATESDALRNEMLRTQIDAMRAKPQPTAQPWKFDSDRGLFYNDAGETKSIPGIGPKQTPVAPRNIDPLSPEGIKAAEDRARRLATVTPPKPAAQRLLPSSAVDKLTGIDNMMSMATDVRDALQGAIKTKTDVTGRIGGVIPTPSWMKNLGTNIGQAAGLVSEADAGKAKDIRAMIGNMYSTIAKEKAGTAMSAAEQALLESYVPNGNESETDALIKANRFIKTLEAMRKNRIDNYQRYGYGIDDAAPVGDQMEQITYSPNNPYAPKRRTP